MSDQSDSLKHSEVEHSNHLSECIGSLLFSAEYSDVTLIVEGESLPAHKIILASSCDYFRALLFGGMRESSQREVVLQDVPLKAFKLLLGYIYTGHLTLGGMKEDAILEILELAHKYGFEKLQTALCRYLQEILSVRNVCTVYDKAQLYNIDHLIKTCCRFIDRHAGSILQSEAFLQLSGTALKEMLSRDSFFAEEIEIFGAVKRWCSERADDEDNADILKTVRLPLIATADLLSTVRASGLIPPDRLLDAIQKKTESRDIDLNYRGLLVRDENIATASHGACVITGSPSHDLLEPKMSRSYDIDRGFTRHCIEDEKGITIELGQPSIINHISFRLWDKDPRTYSYYVELSMNLEDWFRVIDHSTYPCRSLQRLYFEDRVVRYVRVVGTHNAANNLFHLVTFEAMYTEMPFKLSQGNYVPEENVASVEREACVIEGVSRSRHTLINGNFTDYDWDSGYTCHQVGAGSIVVQLPQPFMVDSIRMLLWDCDSRSYSYYIETSLDLREWTRVADRSAEHCRSWQILTFKPLPVVFIRIVGTANTANEVFHCVHFECPAQVRSLDECPASGREVMVGAPEQMLSLV
ncbi:BTB/POZ domain-containing protein 9 [Galendromus occidentalis]|uniref:BTB/POZ domain-containing protein 9 n=1 Tax=Galendromus occidentalis TaxID=34638 RepID=A0AAJ7L584_9ACAR|nr:BTB/POZ domain-containing protein 9 [Galendromus occidentalis]